MQLDAKDKLTIRRLLILRQSAFCWWQTLASLRSSCTNADIPDQLLDILLERYYDHLYLQDFVAENLTKLTSYQKFAYETITNDIARRNGGYSF